jgi:hypothetical protein
LILPARTATAIFKDGGWLELRDRPDQVALLTELSPIDLSWGLHVNSSGQA